MTVPVAGDHIFKVTTKNTMHGFAVWNVTFWRTDASVTDPAIVAANVRAAWETTLVPTMSVELEIDEVECQEVFPLVGPLVTEPWSSPPTRVAAQALPNQIAMVCTHRSASPGRRARGRSFLGGFTEDQFDGATGRFVASVVANIIAQWISLRGTIAAQQTHVIWSTGSLVGPSPQYYDVTSTVAKAIPAVQRKRRIGVGI